MASTFHWIRVKAICYATEDEDLICDTVSELTGSEELDIDISEGLHNNPLTVVDVNLSKNKEYATLFSNLGEDRLNSSAHRLLVDFSNKDESKLAFIVYDRETNRPMSSLHVPMEEFNNLVKEFSVNDQLMNELDTLFPSCYVSVDRLFG